ncbi:MAG: hypothetical protein AB1627_02505 [Chloroflexota bacterium]
MGAKKNRERVSAAADQVVVVRNVCEHLERQVTRLVERMNDLEKRTGHWYSVDGYGTVVGVMPESDFHDVATGEGLVAFRGLTIAAFLDGLEELLAEVSA